MQRYEESHGYRKPESTEDDDNLISTIKTREKLDGLIQPLEAGGQKNDRKAGNTYQQIVYSGGTL